MKTPVISSLLLLASISSFSQNVNIPDANFKAYLLGNTAINTNSDSEIQLTEASSFTGYIYCGGLSISDLTGVEAFTSLTELACNGNSLTSLDVSSNTSLYALYCQNNALNSLNLSSNTSLLELNCSNNNLNSLDISMNSSLVDFNCDGNNISSLDLTNNTALVKLKCADNLLSNLDISNNSNIDYLRCNGNSITSLVLTNLTNLVQVFCNDNNLEVLNLANGNNMSITGFSAINNPNLTCIQVDDVNHSTNNWTQVDSGASFSLNCNPTALSEELQMEHIQIYPNPALDYIQIEKEFDITGLKLMSISGKVIRPVEPREIIDVSDLLSGIYLLEIRTVSGTYYKRFCKK